MRNLFTFIFVFSFMGVNAQSVYIPTGGETYHLIDRLEIKSGQLSPFLYTTIKPYLRADVATMTDSFKVAGAKLSSRDYFNMSWIQADNPDYTSSENGNSTKSIFHTFYKSKGFLFSKKTSDFELFVNPVLNLGTGAQTFDDRTLFINTRGVEMRGKIGKKVDFYTFITDNQFWAPEHLNRYIESHGYTFPGVGYLKPFKESKLDKTYDFFLGRGYISFNPIKQIDVQFGHDKNFIGNGYRSLILSDFAKDYLFLKLNTKVWKFNYENLFMNLVDYNWPSGQIFGGTGRAVLGGKYAAFHHLSMNVTKRLNIGLFEQIIFHRGDSLGNGGGFDFNYLNPVIFYRSVEQNIGNSEDNAILGGDFKWILGRSISAYGQLVLDEFVLSHLRSQDGWWANKYAYQLGIKYIDVAGVSNLDIQVEYNAARPYTYTHFYPNQSNSHYGQPLAHPLGANFYEGIFIVRYQPLNRWWISGKTCYMVYGADTGSGPNHYGSNIFVSYRGENRIPGRDLGNYIGQGNKTTVLLSDWTVSYQWKHNVWFELRYTYRKQNDALQLNTYTNHCFMGQLRMNIPNRQFDF